MNTFVLAAEPGAPPSSIPEPATLLGVASGLGLVLLARRKNMKTKALERRSLAFSILPGNEILGSWRANPLSNQC